jgi:SAM-dependent methyltransferase
MQLLRSPLVRALDPAFQELLDEIARSRGWPTSAAPARVGALVRKLSLAYNDARCAPPRTSEALAARLLFSFARDAPKGAAAVRELVASGALSFDGRPELRVLDVGAGLGAASRGVACALAAHGASGVLRVDACDSDREALSLAASIARARPREGGVRLELGTSHAGVGQAMGSGLYDVIVVGQVHAELLARLGASLAPGGSIVVIEPALRERTRHLHDVRDLVVGKGFNVFAPCVHDAACPMRLGPDDWCHEDLDVDLPGWLVPIAKSAGLRWQGLTFSYLVLRRDGRRFAGGGGSALRVISSPVLTKGKRELFLCGQAPGALGAVRLKAMRLDRHASSVSVAWDQAARGDVVEVTPPLDVSRPRVEAATSVRLVTGITPLSD